MGKGVRRLETERKHCFRDLKNKLDYQHRWSATVCMATAPCCTHAHARKGKSVPVLHAIFSLRKGADLGQQHLSRRLPLDSRSVCPARALLGP